MGIKPLSSPMSLTALWLASGGINCATATLEPGANLSAIKSYYVGPGLALPEIQNAMSCRFGFHASTGVIASGALNAATYKLDRKAIMIMMERHAGGPHKNPHRGFAGRDVIYSLQR